MLRNTHFFYYNTLHKLENARFRAYVTLQKAKNAYFLYKNKKSRQKSWKCQNNALPLWLKTI